MPSTRISNCAPLGVVVICSCPSPLRPHARHALNAALSAASTDLLSRSNQGSFNAGLVSEYLPPIPSDRRREPLSSPRRLPFCSSWNFTSSRRQGFSDADRRSLLAPNSFFLLPPHRLAHAGFFILSQPDDAGGRSWGFCGEARLDEVGRQGTRTQRGQCDRI